MDYTLTRSNRKTCAIYIRNNEVAVRAPLLMPKYLIDEFVTLKSDWINTKLAEAVLRAERKSEFSLSYGDTVHYRGKNIPIIEKQGKRIELSENGFYIPQNLNSEQIKNACIKIYRILAKSVLTEKAYDFAKIMDVLPSSIKINSARTRWGSCSNKKNLNFSWRLMMAEDCVIDYVVIHELAHLKELNHSPQFWTIVEKTLPDYKEKQCKLKILQKDLREENWD